MNVLELFSGIGGMHMALKESGINGQILASIEINPTANQIYKHNFPDVNLLNMNIEGLTVKLFNKYDIDTILMSPPCQPFTRNGLKNDIKDPRTNPFIHVLNLLPQLKKVNRVLIENVKGFDKSEMRDILLKTLSENDFNYQEFIISPTQIGVPNSRHRYYCLAKRKPDGFSFKTGELMENLPTNDDNSECFQISDILEESINTEDYKLPEKLLKKRLKVLDICYSDSRRSCCFTKAYSRFLEGTGSVYTDKSEEELSKLLQKLEKTDCDSDEYLELLESLNLRFFTPTEVCSLMSFPAYFNFPETVSRKQKYMVLGNSINVKVVAELIKLLQ